MFKRNVGYQQTELFGFEDKLTKKQLMYLNESTEFTFFKEVFQKIDESLFSPLFSSTKSRPNAPINQLVGSLILKHLYDWTYSELFKNLTFNTLTRYAIGIKDPSIDIFSEATIFNFQNRVIKYYEENGRDLVTEVFDTLTSGYLKQFKVLTNRQRGDSFLVDSKVIEYSRLRLFVEVLKRLSRVLDSDIKEAFYKITGIYQNKTAGQYVYEISKDELPSEHNQIAQIYFEVNQLIEGIQNESAEVDNFIRVYKEYFVFEKQKITVKPIKDSNSNDLKSPDDPEATFSSKYGNGHVGYSTHLSETVHPENKINLITDIVVVKNNVSDDKILEQRIPELKKKTPELKEYFADSAYANENIDKLNKEHGITQFQNGVKGRKSEANLRINKKGELYIVTCAGGQNVEAFKTEKKYKVVFDPEKCKNCPVRELCKIKSKGGKKTELKRYYYFDEKNILAHERIQNIEKLPPELRTSRCNVEATVKELKRGVKNGKVRVRQWIRVSFHMVFTAISVNLRRIHLKNENNTGIAYSKTLFIVIFVDTVKKNNKYLKEIQLPFYRIAA
jgi:hypothetical protein